MLNSSLEPPDPPRSHCLDGCLDDRRYSSIAIPRRPDSVPGDDGGGGGGSGGGGDGSGGGGDSDGDGRDDGNSFRSAERHWMKIMVVAVFVVSRLACKYLHTYDVTRKVPTVGTYGTISQTLSFGLLVGRYVP